MGLQPAEVDSISTPLSNLEVFMKSSDMEGIIRNNRARAKYYESYKPCQWCYPDKEYEDHDSCTGVWVHDEDVRCNCEICYPNIHSLTKGFPLQLSLFEE